LCVYIPLFPIYTEKHNKTPCFLTLVLSYDMFRSYEATTIR
jgi:hypothetical protein